MGKIRLIIIILIIIVTDQTSKFYINSLFDKAESIEIASFVKLVEVWNPGISFGIFNTLPRSNIFFLTSSILIIFIFIYLAYKSSNELISIGYSLMIGGAIGNVVDRIYWGAVYDFICFNVGNLHWPAFNLADIYISCGMFTLLYKWYIHDRFVYIKNKK